MLHHLQKQNLGFTAATIEPGEKNLQLYKFAQSLGNVQICTLRLNLLINFYVIIRSVYIQFSFSEEALTHLRLCRAWLRYPRRFKIKRLHINPVYVTVERCKISNPSLGSIFKT